MRWTCVKYLPTDADYAAIRRIEKLLLKIRPEMVEAALDLRGLTGVWVDRQLGVAGREWIMESLRAKWAQGYYGRVPENWVI